MDGRECDETEVGVREGTSWCLWECWGGGGGLGLVLQGA